MLNEVRHRVTTYPGACNNSRAVATTPLQFRNGVYHFVTELSTSFV